MTQLRVLLLEQLRYPEATALPAAATALGAVIDTVDPFSLQLRVQGGSSISRVQIARDESPLRVSCYDALVIRSYRSFALTKALAHEFAQQGKPVLGLDPFHPAFVQDKLSDLLDLAKAGVAVPETWSCRAAAPGVVVAKTNWGFGGQGVSLLNEGEDTPEPWNTHYQAFLPAAFDWRVLLCEGAALPWVVVRRPSQGDFRTNTHQGGSPEVLPLAEVPEAADLIRSAELAAHVLGRPNAGVDLRMGLDGRPAVLEVNRTPRLRLGAHTDEIAAAYVSAWLKETARQSASENPRAR